MFVVGDVKVRSGAVVSRFTVIVLLVVLLPAASLWAAVIALLPSPLTKVTVAEKLPDVHVGMAPVATPPPAIVIVRVFSEHVPLTVTPLAALKYADAAGVVIATAGAVLSTTKVALGPSTALVLPALSVATPAAILIATVPLPEQLVNDTVRAAVPLPDTALLHVAPPVVVRVTLLANKETELTPLPPVSAKVRA